MSNAIYRKTNTAVQIHLFYCSSRLGLPGLCMWIINKYLSIKYTNCWDENTVVLEPILSFLSFVLSHSVMSDSL